VNEEGRESRVLAVRFVHTGGRAQVHRFRNRASLAWNGPASWTFAWVQYIRQLITSEVAFRPEKVFLKLVL
jgi:hypothetical protein